MMLAKRETQKENNEEKGIMITALAIYLDMKKAKCEQKRQKEGWGTQRRVIQKFAS
jgi:hypothetical protein